jgi:nicotinamidase-related amidase
MARTRNSGARQALLILDMISEFDFPHGRELVRPAENAARHVVRMKQRAGRAGWPVIYVNDAPRIWESDRREFVRRCSQPDCRGRRIAEMLAPDDSDYFVFKPRHSAFFDTPLNSLLQRLRVTRLILTGVTAHQCVLFTAMDAHIREYDIAIPDGCIASPRAVQTRHALAIMTDALSARLLKRPG